MNLKKTLATAAVAASMGISAVCAMNVGIVNVDAVVQAYPGVQSYIQKEKAVSSQYAPKLEKVAAEIRNEKDRAKAEKIYNESYVPVQKQASEAVNAIWKNVFDKINNAINTVREAKKMPMVVSNPGAIVSAEEGTEGVDITGDVIKIVNPKAK